MTATLMIALLMLPASATPRENEPSCATVRPETFNRGLRVRRTITGNDQNFATRPVCEPLYGRLRRSVRKARGKCRANSAHETASWYGGYGGTASGVQLTPTTIGVANKYEPFGREFYFRHNGRVRRAPVIDRGPFVAGRDWDLTEGLANALGFDGVATVEVNRRNCWVRWG